MFKQINLSRLGIYFDWFRINIFKNFLLDLKILISIILSFIHWFLISFFILIFNLCFRFHLTFALLVFYLHFLLNLLYGCISKEIPKENSIFSSNWNTLLIIIGIKENFLDWKSMPNEWLEIISRWKIYIDLSSNLSIPHFDNMIHSSR